MRTIAVLLITLLCIVPANAVVITCVDEGSDIVRIDYDATDETVLPVAFALDVTVDNGAVIQVIYDYIVGDSTAANRGFGIFPASIEFDAQGGVSHWGSPHMNPTQTPGVQPGLGTSGVTIGMATRYAGSENAPLPTGTLCRFRVDPRGAATVNVKVAANAFGGGVVLANGTTAPFTGRGCTLSASSPVPPPAPASISYPATSSTGKYTVSWPASTGAASYQLERSADSGSTWTGVYSGADVSYAQTVGNGTYRYRVRAANSAGASAWTTGTTSCVVSLSTTPSAPQPPASITYPATSSTGKYTVSWAASTDATSYRLERCRNGGSWRQVYSGSATAYAQIVGNGRYLYRVQAANSVGTSSWRTGTGSCVVSINHAHDD